METKLLDLDIWWKSKFRDFGFQRRRTDTKTEQFDFRFFFGFSFRYYRKKQTTAQQLHRGHTHTGGRADRPVAGLVDRPIGEQPSTIGGFDFGLFILEHL